MDVDANRARRMLRFAVVLCGGLIAMALPVQSLAVDTSPSAAGKPAAPIGGHDLTRPWIMRQVADSMASAKVGPLQPRGAVVPLGPRRSGIPAAAGLAPASASLAREVFGFANAGSLTDPSVGYTTWDFPMLSTVAYFGVHVNSADGSLVQGDTGWAVWHSSAASSLINMAHVNGVRVVLTLIFQSQVATDMCSALDHAATTASQAASQLQGADGVNIDYEGTNAPCPDGVSERSKLITFTRTLRGAGLGYLSIDTYAGSPEDSGGFFDVASLSPLVDSFFAMDYDLELSNGPCAACIGPTSPLSGSPTYAWNVTRSANDYRPWAAQTILGFPYYGVKGCVQGPNPPPNAPVTGQFAAEPYTGIITYPTDPKITSWNEQRDPVDPAGQEPWAGYFSGYVNCWREEYWDDPVSLGHKYDLVNSYGFRGAGLFTLDYGGGRPELWDTIASRFSTGNMALLSSPIAISSAPGRVDVFWRGADNALWHRWYANGWHGPETLGGSLASDPSAVTSSSGVMDVFWKGADGQLWHRWYVGGSWYGPQSLGDGPLGEPPHAVGQPNGVIDVFWRGSGPGALWHAWYAGGWYGPQLLEAGTLASDPAPVSSSPGVLDVFWKGTDSALWHMWYANGWYGPQSLGDGPLGGGPQAVGQPNGVIDVFWRGNGSAALWHAWYAGAWYGPQQLEGGPLGSDPAPVNSSPGVLDVFWQGSDGALWHMWYANGWQGPQSLGDGPLGGPPQAVGQASGIVDVFWRGGDSGLWHAWYTSGWYGPERL